MQLQFSFFIFLIMQLQFQNIQNYLVMQLQFFLPELILHKYSVEGYHKTTRVFVSMNTEAGQTQESKRRHNYRKDLDPEKLDWLVWLSHNWTWYFAVNRI